MPKFEQEKLSERPYRRVVGVDEVGRGCWAGPIYFGSYVFDSETEPVEGVNDSKKLSSKKRDLAYQILSKHKYKIHEGSVEDINQKGLGDVIKSIIASIVNHYDDGETLILLDGYFPFNFGKNVLMLKKGDSTYYSIAAASILAKVERDRLMEKLSIQYGGYGFELHKGYGTKIHREKLSQIGICPIHRKTYKPIAEYL